MRMFEILLALIIGAFAIIIYAMLGFTTDPVSQEKVAQYIKRGPPEAASILFGEAEVDLSVIVPAYNEAERIQPMLAEALTYLEKRRKPFTFEVIVVDDGSSDGTYDAVPMQESIRRIELTRNMGKGFAVRVGALAARGKKILMVDADGATKFEDLASLEKQSTDLVFGSRNHLQEEAMAQRAWYRNVLMKLFHLVVTTIVGTPIRDTQCGFKLFTRAAAQRIFPSLHINRWAFDIELVVLAQYLNLSVAEVPVHWHEVPGSKLNVAVAMVQMFRDICGIRLLYNLRVWQPKEMMG